MNLILLLLFLIQIVLCIQVFLEDLKERKISFLAIIFLLFSSGSYSYIKYGRDIFINYSFGILYVSLMILFITLYFSFKNSRIVNVFKAYIGLGDVFFIVSICGLFFWLNLIFYLIITGILTILVYKVVSLFNTKINDQIPFASFLSLTYILALVFDKLDFYSMNSELVLFLFSA